MSSIARKSLRTRKSTFGVPSANGNRLAGLSPTSPPANIVPVSASVYSATWVFAAAMLVSRPESSLILTAQSPVGVDDRLGVLRPCEGLRLFVVDADEPMNLVA